MNTEWRKNSNNESEKNILKLMNNSIFGKSMEDVLNKCNFKLMGKNGKYIYLKLDQKQALKYLQSPGI